MTWLINFKIWVSYNHLPTYVVHACHKCGESACDTTTQIWSVNCWIEWCIYYCWKKQQQSQCWRSLSRIELGGIGNPRSQAISKSEMAGSEINLEASILSSLDINPTLPRSHCSPCVFDLTEVFAVLGYHHKLFHALDGPTVALSLWQPSYYGETLAISASASRRIVSVHEVDTD